MHFLIAKQEDIIFKMIFKFKNFLVLFAFLRFKEKDAANNIIGRRTL